MSSTTPGRHRAPRSLSAARLVRGSTSVVAGGGLIVSMSAGAQAAPASGVAATPSAVTPATTPVVVPTLPLPSRPAATTTLRWGSRGDAVRTVQGIVGTSADGIFGPKTHAAVKRYQSRNGLVADGIVGPITSRSMGLTSGTAASSSRESTSSSRSSARTAPSASSTSSSSASGVLGVAARYTGIMYQWGGTSPSTGFDCSGYTQYVFAQVGITLPRSAEAQRQVATPVSNPRPGDLVFYGAPAYHMGIYTGDGMMYDSGRAGLPTQKRKIFSGVTSYGRVG